jgi:adenylate cyclase
MASTRRLAAILAADVAGYSRLMGADEEGTLERLKAHRRQQHALALDPGSIDAQSWLANGLAGRVLDGKSDSPAEDIKRAEALLAPALATSPRNPFLHHNKGQVLRAQAQGPFGLDASARTARFAEAIPEYEIVLAANPNDVHSLGHLGWCKIMTGLGDEGIQFLEKAVRLSPRDPGLYLWSSRIGVAHLFQSRTDDAIVWLEKSRRANPGFTSPRLPLAAAYGLKGETDRAAAELVEALRLIGNDRFSTIARVRINSLYNTPILHDGFENVYLAGLRKAGMPEE